jgi:hypothetical protein
MTRPEQRSLGPYPRPFSPECNISICVLRTHSMAMILASFAATRFSSFLFIIQE